MVPVCLDRFGITFGEVSACCSPDFYNSGVEYRYPNPTLEFGYRYLLGRVSVPLVSHQVSIPASKGIDTPLLFHLVSVPRERYRYPSPLWDLSIDTGFRVPIPAA
ncbi:hypothetical protein GQ457_04G021210 [Hibiscus cannabinus]